MSAKDNVSKILLIILIILTVVAGVLIVNKNFSKEGQKILDIAKKEEKTTVATQPGSLAAVGNKQEEQENLETQIFGQYYKQAETLLNTMTLEEKVGQMFIIKYPEKYVIEEIKELNPCGYILDEKDFKNKTKQSIVQELNKLQENSKIKLALAVNEEGGTEVSVSSNKNLRKVKFNSPQSLWKQGQIGLIIRDSTEKSILLKSLGINMNLVPVADVPSNSTDYIYERAYGRGVENTSTYVSELIKTMNKDGMISTMKHFPGYGNNKNGQQIITDQRSYSTFESIDFLPFKSGIEAGVPTILVNHNIVECMDKKNPASLSPDVHKILREDLKFSGIIMTDDLSIESMKKYGESETLVIKAVKAGNDIIISSNLKTQKEEILQAVEKGEISENVINTAVKRVLAWKYAYSII